MVNILEVDSVQFGFQTEKLLLSDIYLRCRTGEIIALFGRNGCGKSTLLKIIFGTQKAEQSVRLNGKFFGTAFKSGKLAYLPQDGLLPRTLKIEKAIKIFVPGKIAREKLFVDSRIKDWLPLTPEELSGGQLKYLEVKLLLALPAWFLLLDEPFLGIGPLFKEILQQELREASKNRGILITDHDYCSVLEIANKIYFLQNGALKQIKNQEELAAFGYLPGKALSRKR